MERQLRILTACAAILIAIGGCTPPEPTVSATPSPTAIEESPDIAVPAAAPTPTAILKPIVVATDDLTATLSPFDPNLNHTLAALTLGSGLTQRDRAGALVLSGLKGEYRSYNGNSYFYDGIADVSVEYDGESDSTSYYVKLRRGVKFSDGTALTADDVIFTLYLLCDPSYAGRNSLKTVDISGLQEYRQAYLDAQAKPRSAVNAIMKAGSDADDKGNGFTPDQYREFWFAYNTAYYSAVQAIVDYCHTAYAEFADDIAPEEIAPGTADGLKTALAMYVWGFADPIFGGGVASISGDVFNLTTEFPELSDFVAAIETRYPGGYPECSAEFSDVPGAIAFDAFRDAFIASATNLDGVRPAVPHISGIRRISEFELLIAVNGYSASNTERLLTIEPLPLHVYGNADLYDPEGDGFGLVYGSVSAIADSDLPLVGIGAYSLLKFSGGTAYLEPNASYWRGTPNIAEIQLRETPNSNALAALRLGTVDAALLPSDRRLTEELRFVNGGEPSGSTLTYVPHPVTSYGYIGINAANVAIGERGSDASKNLRRGLATVLAAYREESVTAYFGESASVPNYPAPDGSYAAPERSDPRYTTAYSTDVNGNAIYRSGMSDAERYQAAEQAALGFFLAAGYSVEGGRVTAAPVGAKLSFNALIPASEPSDHPSYLLLVRASDSLANIGLELNIRAVGSMGELRSALYSETAEIWCAAREFGASPDLFPLYHSTGLIGTGTDTNIYGISDSALDALMQELRSGDSILDRRVAYREAFSVLLAWAVEIPAYQRMEAWLFRSSALDALNLPPDMTAHYDWTSK
ncbi:MAG: ABC transporter substrate-binding protein [Oscillospiraceae bacterium]|jgi:peptide/nickel transport system substrate-binding protein|nr:ABC transporter substrate-binding protein [Oscillospiraceae bacterium]